MRTPSTLRRILACSRPTLVAPLALLAGCATMFTGTTSDVRFDAQPPGGTVVVDEQRYELPATVEVAKSTETVRFEHPEHDAHEVALDGSVNAGFVIMDVLFTPGWGLVGLIVDGSTSAWVDLPTHVDHDFRAPTAEPDEE